jgi:hypothetical protein
MREGINKTLVLVNNSADELKGASDEVAKDIINVIDRGGMTEEEQDNRG